MKTILFFLFLSCACILPAEENEVIKFIETGLKNQFQIDSFAEYRLHLRTLLNYSSDELRNQVSRKDSSLAGSLPLAEAIVHMEATDSRFKSEMQRLRLKYQNDRTLQIEETDAERINSSFYDEGALKTLERLYELSVGGKSELSLELQSPNSASPVLHLRYTPKTGDSAKHLEIEAVILVDCKLIEPANIVKGAIINQHGTLIQALSRTDTSRMSSLAIVVKGRPSIKLEIPPLVSSSEMPIGTIISSAANWEQFQKIMKIPEGSIDASKLPWVPCDGRNVRESTYAKILRTQDVPDLRGVFIRGMNRIDSGEKSPVDASRADPDTNRELGKVQMDSLQEHQHQIGVVAKGGGVRNASGNEDAVQRNPAAVNSREIVGTDVRVSTETRPKNIALYYYVRIN